MSIDTSLPLVAAIDRHRAAVARVGGPAFQWTPDRHPVSEADVHHAAATAGWDLTDDAIAWWTSTSWSPAYWEVHIGPNARALSLVKAVALAQHMRYMTAEDTFDSTEWMPIVDGEHNYFVVDLGAARLYQPHVWMYSPENGDAASITPNLSSLVQWWTDNVDHGYWRWDPHYRRDEVRGRWQMGSVPTEISGMRYDLL